MSRRPTIPTGAHAYTSQDAIDGSRWSVRLCLAGQEPGPWCKRLSPVFACQTTAYSYLDWVEGRAERFEYPVGQA